MIIRSGKVLTLFLLAFASTFALPRSSGPQEKIREVWRWHSQGYEIYDAAFSAKNGQIAFVRRNHIPDGHEAESFSKEELNAYTEKVEQNNRYADPEIVLMTIGSPATARVDWGWEPCFSPDGQRIAYSHQKNPMANFRDSANTRKENEVREYDLSTRTSRTLAVSKRGGFVSGPLYSPDGRELVYSDSTGVNAGWQSAEVGVRRLALDSMKEEILLAPRYEFGFLSIIRKKYYSSGKLFAIRARPSSGGKFLPDRYAYELLELGGEPKVVRDMGEFSTFKGPEIGEESPDGRFVVAEPKRAGIYSGGGGGWITLTPLNGSDATINWSYTGDLEQVKWAPDSKRLAFVQTVRRGAIFLYDEIVVLEIF